MSDVLDEMSFLEVLDILNENLVREGKEAVEFDSDCREGICGTCGLVIKGTAHGPHPATTTCEVRMRHFHDGETEWTMHKEPLTFEDVEVKTRSYK